MTPPRKIKFVSDNCEAELILKAGKTKDKDEFLYYKYTKSITNMGVEFPMSKIMIDKLVSMKLLIVEN